MKGDTDRSGCQTEIQESCSDVKDVRWVVRVLGEVGGWKAE
jgi:hypothetical protein